MKLFIQLGADSSQLAADMKAAGKIVKDGGAKAAEEFAKGADPAAKSTDNVAKSTQALRTQMRAATIEAQKLAQAYGLNHQATREAAARAADLRDQMEDVNDMITASHPDAPFKAMNNVLSSSAGVFAGVQGGIAMLDDDTGNLQKTFMKLQAAMALAQGIESIRKAGDAFRDLGWTINGPVIQSLGKMKLALIATGIGALAVAIGMLVTHFDNVGEAANRAEEQMLQAAEAARADWQGYNDALAKSASSMDEQLAMQKDLEKARAAVRGAGDEEMYQIDLKYAKKQRDIYKQTRDDMQQGSAERIAMNDQYWKQVNAIEVMELNRQAERNKKYLEAEKKRRAEAARLSITADPLAGKFGPVKTDSAEKSVKALAKSIDGALKQIEYSGPAMVNKWADAMQKMRQATQSAAADISIGLGEALGTALVSGDWAGFFNSVIGQFADFLKQLGALFIAYGIAQTQFGAALTAGPIGGPLAIAAGAALVAAGGAIKALLSQKAGRGGGDGGGSGGGGFSGYRATPFADGGIVSGPTFALVGEYSGARNNPEVIAPLDKLKAMLSGHSGQVIIPALRLTGQDMLISFDRSNQRRKRF